MLNCCFRYTTYLCNKELSTRVVKKVENMSLFSFVISQSKENPECNNLGLGMFFIETNLIFN